MTFLAFKKPSTDPCGDPLLATSSVILRHPPFPFSIPKPKKRTFLRHRFSKLFFGYVFGAFLVAFWSIFAPIGSILATFWPLKANFSQKRSHAGFVRFPKGKPSFAASKGGLCSLQRVFFSIFSCHVFAIVFLIDFLMVLLPPGTLFGTRLAL